MTSHDKISCDIKMAVFISAFENTTPLGVGNWTSDDVRTDRSAILSVLVSSDNNLTLNFNWSNDGISTVLTESEAIVGGTPAEHFRPVKAKYLNIELVNGGTNTSLVVQGFFFDSESVMLAIRNLGTGTHVGNLNKLGLRSLKSSDASITITNTADEIDLVSAGSGTTVVALNDNVQVTEAPAGQFNVGVGQDTANSLNLGWNTPLPASGTNSVNLGYGRSTGNNVVAIGAGTSGAGNGSSDNCVSIGSNVSTAGMGTYSVGIGNTIGGSTANAVGVGTVAIGGLVLGSGTANTAVGIGYNCMSVGATRIANDSVAIGYEALTNVTNSVNSTSSVAIGRKAGGGSTSYAGNNVSIGHFCCANGTYGTGNTVIGYYAGYNKAMGTNSVIVGSSTDLTARTIGNGAILVGNNAGAGGTVATNEICIGASCVPANVSGRLSFGNSMETAAAVSGTPSLTTNLIPLAWNGTVFKIPALGSSATDLKAKMEPMCIGELYYADATGTTTSGINTAGGIAISATPAVTLDTSSDLASSAHFDEPSNGQLRYLGTTTTKFHCAFSLSASCGSPNQSLSFWIKKTGSTVAKSVYYFTNPAGGNNFTVAAHAVIDLATNDYLEVWGENTSGANEITIRNINLVAIGDGSVV